MLIGFVLRISAQDHVITHKNKKNILRKANERAIQMKGTLTIALFIILTTTSPPPCLRFLDTAVAHPFCLQPSPKYAISYPSKVIKNTKLPVSLLPIRMLHRRNDWFFIQVKVTTVTSTTWKSGIDPRASLCIQNFSSLCLSSEDYGQ